MSLELPFVTADELHKRLPEPLLGKVAERSESVSNERFRKVLRRFSKSLTSYYKKQLSAHSDLGVFSSVDDQSVSMIQSFLSAWAGNSGNVEPSESGDFSADLSFIVNPDEIKGLRWIDAVDWLTNLTDSLEKRKKGFINRLDINVGRDLKNLSSEYIYSRLNSWLGSIKGELGDVNLPYGEKDLGWIGFFFAMLMNASKCPWRNFAQEDIDLPESTRLALLGDWGTGMYGAPVSSNSIKNDSAAFQAIIHLGDIYYSGSEQEVETNFLNPFPDLKGATRRALNGNHEMYSGGHAYFNRILSEFGQDSSYFSWENEHWLIVGLDTAYHAGILEGRGYGRIDEDQLAWFSSLSERKDQSLILLTHHHPYSLIEGKGPLKHASPVLIEVGKILKERTRPVFWYWGHEHACVLHDYDETFGFWGRCVGHGGYAYKRLPNRFVENSIKRIGLGGSKWRELRGRKGIPGGLYLADNNAYITRPIGFHGANGYMTIEVDSNSLTEFVHRPDSTVIYKRTFL